MMDNADEAAAVARAVQASDRLFFTAYMKRLLWAVAKAQELLPALGRLFSAQVRVYQAWGNYYEVEPGNPPGWVIGKYGGAVIKCAASHMLDMTLNLLGRPQRLYAVVDYIPKSEFDRKASALLEYPEGLVVSFEAAVHPLKHVGYERNSWDQSIQINGTRGRLDLYFVRWDAPEHNGALLVHYDDERETSTEHRFRAVNPFNVELAYFHDCLARREQGHPDVKDGFAVDLLMEALVESSLRRVPLDLDYRGL